MESKHIMNSNYYKLFMKLTGTKYGKNLLLKGIPFIYKKKDYDIVIMVLCFENYQNL